jgi:(E)-2-((N-methylformamido)methylene)succinate hydrolase
MLTTPQRSRSAAGAAYVEQGAGEPVLLIHGVGMRLEAWSQQSEALAATHRVISVDMPGHGESGRLADDASLQDFVSWFSSTIDDLGLDRVNVAGHSMGALIAAGLAATMGERITRVALLNGVHKRSPDARAAVEERARRIRAGDYDFQAPLDRWFGASEKGTDAYRLTRKCLLQVDPQGYATAYFAFATGDDVYADAWPNIACPALFLTGEMDANSSPEMSLAMAAAAKDGLARIVKGHRHMVNLTAPAIVTQHLKDWLARDEVKP